MPLRDELAEWFTERKTLIDKPDRTEEDEARLRQLTALLASALPLENALALVQDEVPTKP